MGTIHCSGAIHQDVSGEGAGVEMKLGESIAAQPAWRGASLQP